MDKELKLRKDTVLIGDSDIEIVEALKNDATIRQTAQILKINVRTLEGRVNKLKAKTGAKTLHGLLWLFHQNGLIS